MENLYDVFLRVLILVGWSPIKKLFRVGYVEKNYGYGVRVCSK
jgi:hypothetical protein